MSGTLPVGRFAAQPAYSLSMLHPNISQHAVAITSSTLSPAGDQYRWGNEEIVERRGKGSGREALPVLFSEEYVGGSYWLPNGHQIDVLIQ